MLHYAGSEIDQISSKWSTGYICTSSNRTYQPFASSSYYPWFYHDVMSTVQYQQLERFGCMSTATIKRMKCRWEDTAWFVVVFTSCQRHACVVVFHYGGVIMGTMVSQITSPTIVYSKVHSGADQRKHQSSASLAFARRIHRWAVTSPHQGPVKRKMFPLDDIII